MSIDQSTAEAAEHNRVAERPSWTLLAAVTLLIVCLIPARRIPLDLRVYRGAVEAMLSGGDLYGFAIPDLAGPATFLYPPFAALLVVPTLLVPDGVASNVWALAQIGLAAVLAWLVARGGELKLHSDPFRRRLFAYGVWAALAVSYPVLSNISNGQVSLTIITLVMVDLLMLPPRWRGVLIGVAAAIKLTPLVIVVYFAASKQWRAAAMSVATFAAAGVAGLIALPQQSAVYWTRIVFDASRVPSIDSQRNLSILGALQFWAGTAGWVRMVWMVTAAVVLFAAVRAAYRHQARGEAVAAAIVVGTASAIVSPVAWEHYLVWLPLAGLYLALSGTSGWSRAGWTLLAFLTPLSPIWPVDGAPLWWSAVGAVPGLLAVTICLCGLPSKALRTHPVREDDHSGDVPRRQQLQDVRPHRG